MGSELRPAALDVALTEWLRIGFASRPIHRKRSKERGQVPKGDSAHA
jgi:hypothetical protein